MVKETNKEVGKLAAENPKTPDKQEIRKVQLIAESYYSRKDVQQAIYDFCKLREVVPNFNTEFFGKRPDTLDYASDIFNYVKKGATSFHCSEEIWFDPLKISTDLTPEQLSELRQGWDFLIDIDSKYLDYSKIAAKLIIKALEYNGVKNIGIKYSGSKGFHLIVPWKAFPKEFSGEQTKNMFPEWPRLIAGYIHEIIKDKLNEKILEVSNRQKLEEKGEIISKNLCPRCGRESVKKKVIYFSCPNCKAKMQSMTGTTKKSLRCPNCNYDMNKTGEEEIAFCNYCNINTNLLEAMQEQRGERTTNIQQEFKKEETTKSQEDSVDIILVSSRHLFRCPYSLHEKTALASIVIDKNKIDDFQPQDADPLKVKPISFTPACEEGEAKELLMQALDWAKKKNIPSKKFTGTSIDVKDLTISEDMFPDCIKTLMKGMKADGRKRALFVLLSFFRSLDFPRDYIEEKIGEWNKKNYKPLKEGYIKSQVSWFDNSKKILPPNCDKPYYKELGVVCQCKGVKNPINFTIREALKRKPYSKKKVNKLDEKASEDGKANT